MITKRPRDPRTTLPLGPWKGVRDLGDAGMQSAEYLQDAINGYFQDSQNGGSIWARPGFRRHSGSTALAGTSGNEVLGLHEYVGSDGLLKIFASLYGKLYRETTITTWDDVSPAALDFAQTVHIKAVNYNSELIFAQASVGVKPWRLTNPASSPVTRTAIEVDSTPHTWSVRNAPTIYGSKLFCLVDEIAATYYGSRIVWSEELAAGTGYMQSGYANYWDVNPSSTESMTAILGTNTGLYYFRLGSIGLITGAVNSTFTTTSTHDAVTQEVGCLGTVQPIIAKNYIWFLNRDGLPCRFRVGSSEIEPVWMQMRQRITKIKATATSFNTFLLSYQYITYIPDLNKVAILFLRDSTGSVTKSRNLYIFDADTGNYEGRWLIELATQPTTETPTAVSCQSLAIVTAGVGGEAGPVYPNLLVGGSRPDGTAGHVFRQWGHREQTFGDNSAAMHQSVIGMLTPNEQNVEARIDQIAVETVPDTATTLSLDHYTPRVATTGVALAATNSSSDVISSSYDRGIRRAGLNALGRWWRYVLWWNVPSGTTQYVIERASVKVRPQPAGVASP